MCTGFQDLDVVYIKAILFWSIFQLSCSWKLWGRYRYVEGMGRWTTIHDLRWNGDLQLQMWFGREEIWSWSTVCCVISYFCLTLPHMAISEHTETLDCVQCKTQINPQMWKLHTYHVVGDVTWSSALPLCSYVEQGIPTRRMIQWRWSGKL